MKRVIKTVLLELWVSPQLIISYLIYLFFKLCGVVNESVNISDGFKLIYIDMPHLNLNVGYHIFSSFNDMTPNRLNKEIGKCILSCYLGPLFFIVILIPSYIWYIVKYELDLFPYVKYDWFYTEKWAIRLGHKNLKDRCKYYGRK